jgi:hypothetical protein
MKHLSIVLLFVAIFFVSCSDDNPGSPLGGIIKGTVVNSDTREPVADVNIKTKPPTESIFTDENGIFEFSALDEGEYTVIAQKKNFATAEIVVTVKNGKTTQANIVLVDTLKNNYSSVEGKIIDAKTETPIQGVFISTIPKSITDVSDKDGKFKLDFLKVGDYSLVCKKENYRDIVVNFKIIANEITTLLVKMQDRESTNNPPDKPILITPSNNQIVAGDEVLLKWECSDPDNDELTYDVYLSKSNPPDEVIAENIKTNTYKFYPEDNIQDYYWRIIAKDKYGGISQSNIRIFTYDKDYAQNRGLILYYTFDDKNVWDNSGNGNTGILHNTTEFVPGKKGYCIRLLGNNLQDGKGGYVELPFINFVEFSEFTIALWVNEEKAFQNIGQSYIAGDAYINWGIHSEGWVGIGNYSLPPYNNFRAVNFSVGSISEGWQTVPLWIRFDTNYQHNWVHYALVFKNNTVYGYINGELIGRKEQILNSLAKFGAIGKHWWRYDGVHSSTSLNLKVDEVRVYKRALSENEIKLLAQ